MDGSTLRCLARISLATTSAMLASLLAGVASANTITVQTLDGHSRVSGACALADAISAHNSKTAVGRCNAGSGNDLIRFSVTGTIFIQHTLEISSGTLAITGPASNSIIVDGNKAVEVMTVNAGATLNLSNLTIAHGNSEQYGGGVHNDGTLTVSSATFSDNGTNGSGGAIFNGGTLTVSNSAFSNNIANGGAGAIDNFATATVSHSTFSNNIASGGGLGGFGGAIGSGRNTPTGNTLTIGNSRFLGNQAASGGAIFIGIGGSVIVTSSTFSGNNALLGDGKGAPSITTTAPPTPTTTQAARMS